jgi:predicted HicB family RNase H-like nuclease
MPDKYIRVSNKLHEILKIKSARIHVTLKTLVELYLWSKIKKETDHENIL